MKFLLKVFAALIFSAYCGIAFSGQFLVMDSHTTSMCGDYSIDYSGRIETGDSDRLKKILEGFVAKHGKDDCLRGWTSIRLFSDGGDVLEAIKLGKLIRSHHLRAIVPLPAECNSSCVLVFAAAIRKDAPGKVGVHRPFFSNLDKNQSLSDIKNRRDQLTEVLRSYFNEIDIPHSLIDVMLSTPPEKIKYLTEDELKIYRLDGVDASFDEWQTAKTASNYGMTSSEYRTKNQVFSRLCQRDNGLDLACHEARMRGISTNELKRRYELANKNCGDKPSEYCILKYLKNQ